MSSCNYCKSEIDLKDKTELERTTLLIMHASEDCAYLKECKDSADVNRRQLYEKKVEDCKELVDIQRCLQKHLIDEHTLEANKHTENKSALAQQGTLKLLIVLFLLLITTLLACTHCSSPQLENAFKHLKPISEKIEWNLRNKSAELGISDLTVFEKTAAVVSRVDLEVGPLARMNQMLSFYKEFSTGRDDFENVEGDDNLE